MATYEFKVDEAKAFWIASSNLRRAAREGAGDMGVLTRLVEDHARYGVQSAIKARAKELLGERRCSIKAG
ncbi:MULTISPECIES: hypothetical protein [unclassified Mesorhizobium]|uniref:hypothetical protein n=1 Tax=unclassified Mesorhizobium TaxID=325217 RepID=UPI000FCBCF7C|nr:MULTISPECIES: hypothetical protein [unclassified Mesorhizobium]RUY28907.1 hypothetical protein EN979_12055 [Mesorhizobium sp. M7A.F.Ca.US.001.04.2.1]RUY38440.1 hypothetical protein EN978_24035 [Mesorhizobium sp. M7A.F.Ca.US.001.04.1.1]RVA07724.1 hypothetical protein EN938_02115 [Mesorhizobium sp. M7A.F.Ca.US.001.02.1.1]